MTPFEPMRDEGIESKSEYECIARICLFADLKLASFTWYLLRELCLHSPLCEEYISCSRWQVLWFYCTSPIKSDKSKYNRSNSTNSADDNHFRRGPEHTQPEERHRYTIVSILH